MDYDFTTVARLPAPDDNVAIATQMLESGTRIRYNGQQFELSHTILEGHRFAIQSIPEDAPLLSWGLTPSVLLHVPFPPVDLRV